MIVCDNKEEAIETTRREANNVIKFFRNNNLVNNSDKAALLYSTKGKGETITIKIGVEEIK